MRYIFAFLCLLQISFGAAKASDFHSWAARPPMGWNSWDNFATAITEQQAKEQAAFMAKELRPLGWEYFVVDIQWYEPGASSHAYRQDAVLNMDEYGRLMPAPNRFPSAEAGAGFKALAEHVHALGLKFGIHLMRGIPRQAVEKNLPVKGTNRRASDVADKNSTCDWNPDMYGVDMSKPGAQEYYDSVFALIASWGVDYVKVDDIARPYHQAEIEGIRRAIDKTGRPMVLSLSPGETSLDAAAHVGAHANLWRISDDFWDSWPSLLEQFGRLEKWNPHRLEGAWPDADMLPLGVIDLGRRNTRFTPEEQVTLMTLWCIARSPLMHGGDMLKTDAFTLSLLTNPEVLAVNQCSLNNKPLFNHDGLVAWIADVPGSRDRYLALFNTQDRISLDPARAAYGSEVLRRQGATSTGRVTVDVRGAVKMVLVMDEAGDGTDSDVGVWGEPQLLGAGGKTLDFDFGRWNSACGAWGHCYFFDAKQGKRPQVAGKPVTTGISAHAKSIVEFDLPPGTETFSFVGSLDDGALKSKSGATLRFQVFTAKPGAELERPGLAVPVELSSLGFAKGARVRDLWGRKDLGRMKGTYAPVVPWHGALLLRLSEE